MSRCDANHVFVAQPGPLPLSTCTLSSPARKPAISASSSRSQRNTQDGMETVRDVDVPMGGGP